MKTIHLFSAAAAALLVTGAVACKKDVPETPSQTNITSGDWQRSDQNGSSSAAGMSTGSDTTGAGINNDNGPQGAAMGNAGGNGN